MKPARVGVIGAYGVVGRSAVRVLRDSGIGPLRLGGRHVDFARTLLEESPDDGDEARPIDVYDPEQLAAFCADCRVVVNCAGPSFQILERVAVAALAAGADYVDPGGDAVVARRLTDVDWTREGRTALLTAGMMPGLSGLLPRWLARDGFDRTSRLTAYVGGLGRLTRVGAADYLLSLGSGIGQPLAAWRNGGRVLRALQPLTDVALPFFPTGATAYPFLTPETERLALALGLADVSWYTVFEGDHMRSTLGRLQSAIAGRGDLAAGAAELSRAADLDLFGREPYQTMVVELHGEAGGLPRHRTAVLRATDAHELTGAVTALATTAVIGGAVEPGVRFAAEALDAAVMDRLRSTHAVTTLDLFDGACQTELAVEEGVL